MVLTLDEVENYINIKKKNDRKLLDDVKIISDGKDATRQDAYKEVFEQAYKDLCEEARTSNEDVVRKVVFYNNKRHGAHIACFVLFYDKNNKDKPVSLFTGTDNDLKNIMWYCVEDGEHNFWKLNSKKFLDIQKDEISCGVVACEMAKHLTVDWYQQYTHDMKELKQADIDILKRYKLQQGCISFLINEYLLQDAFDTYKINDIADIGLEQGDTERKNEEIIDLLDKKMKETEQQYLILPTICLPKELIAYKQGGLEELKTTYPEIFNKNLKRGNIKRIIENKNGTPGKVQNRRLQDRRKVIKNYKKHLEEKIEQKQLVLDHSKEEAKQLINDSINNNTVKEQQQNELQENSQQPDITKAEAREYIDNYINNATSPKQTSLVDCIKELQKYDDGREFLSNCHCNIALRARAKREHQVFLTYEKILNNNPANVNELVSINDVHSWNMCGCSCC